MRFRIKPRPIFPHDTVSEQTICSDTVRNTEALFNYGRRSRRPISIDFATKGARFHVPRKANAMSLISRTTCDPQQGATYHPPTRITILSAPSVRWSAFGNLTVRVQVIRTCSEVITSHVIPFSDVSM